MIRTTHRATYILAFVLILALGLAGCGSETKKPDAAAAGDTADSDSGLCKEGLAKPPTKKVALTTPNKKLERSKKHFIDFQTTCGNFTIELDIENSPKTAASMAYLAQENVYNDTWFHRIITDFVVQGGDPQGNGSGDAGYKIEEPPADDQSYAVGTVAMAKGGQEAPGTSSSQFFVVIGAQGATLPLDYAIAGQIIKGMDTISTIAGYAGADETPTGTAIIEKATYRSE